MSKRRRTTTTTTDESSSSATTTTPAHVDGVYMQGFLAHAQEMENASDIHSLTESWAEHLMENVAGQHTTVRGMVQLVHTLFEIAAAVTVNLPDAASEDEISKLDLLHQHAKSGMELIGSEKRCEEEEGEGDGCDD